MSKYEYRTFTGSKGRLYGKSLMSLENVSRVFAYSNLVEDGSYFNIERGDSVTIYAKRRIQHLYTFGFSSNVIVVEKGNVEVFNSVSAFEAVTFSLMCFFGLGALLLFFIYLDVVKGISLESWFQKKVLKNPAYINLKKK